MCGFVRDAPLSLDLTRRRPIDFLAVIEQVSGQRLRSTTLAVEAVSADQHLDVRKAAVLGLIRWVDSDPAARAALGVALEDGDADVRAYARRALTPRSA